MCYSNKGVRKRFEESGSGANKGYIQKNIDDSYRNRSLRC